MDRLEIVRSDIHDVKPNQLARLGNQRLFDILIHPNKSSVACVRLLYTLTSYFLLSVDYSSACIRHHSSHAT